MSFGEVDGELRNNFCVAGTNMPILMETHRVDTGRNQKQGINQTQKNAAFGTAYRESGGVHR